MLLCVIKFLNSNKILLTHILQISLSNNTRRIQTKTNKDQYTSQNERYPEVHDAVNGACDKIFAPSAFRRKPPATTNTACTTLQRVSTGNL